MRRIDLTINDTNRAIKRIYKYLSEEKTFLEFIKRTDYSCCENIVSIEYMEKVYDSYTRCEKRIDDLQSILNTLYSLSDKLSEFKIHDRETN